MTTDLKTANDQIGNGASAAGIMLALSFVTLFLKTFSTSQSVELVIFYAVLAICMLKTNSRIAAVISFISVFGNVAAFWYLVLSESDSSWNWILWLSLPLIGLSWNGITGTFGYQKIKNQAFAASRRQSVWKLSKWMGQIGRVDLSVARKPVPLTANPRHKKKQRKRKKATWRGRQAKKSTATCV
jgi:hypothetical protein